MNINGSRYYCQALLLVDYLAPNEPVVKVAFLKTASSAGSKIESYFLPLKVLTTPGTTPKPLTKMETISILYYDCLTLSIIKASSDGLVRCFLTNPPSLPGKSPEGYLKQEGLG